MTQGMANVTALKKTIKEHGETVESVAKKLGIDTSTFYRKLAENGESITVAQVDSMRRILSPNADDAESIFFAS